MAQGVCVLVTLTFLLGTTGTHAADPDPFAGVEPAPMAETETEGGFFSDNFGFRKEIMSEVGTTGPGRSASRQSVGFEVLKKFSTATKTFASFDFQGRLVRRDGFVGSLNDLEGANRPGWFFEYHNAYADFYDVLGPVGRLNVRVGRFYVPFGLNLQTDTHGTILQLSNERGFGFERDWYAGLWGILSDDLRYDVAYLVGSGYGLEFEGQSGLAAARVSLANRYLSEHGWEGGVSLLGGQRLAPGVVNTLRAGLDGRYRTDVPSGLLTWTSELSAGRDASDTVASQVHQIEYLHSSRRWSLGAQTRWFWRDLSGPKVDTSVLGEATWYFRNDVGASNLHWIKLNCEHQLARQFGETNVIWTLQYYFYW